jgi:DnaJ-domain-containing protein 1
LWLRPARVRTCLQRELAALQKSPGRPDLSGIPANEATAIENACGYVRRGSGPAAYYQCLQRELAALQKFLGPRSKRLETSELATGSASRLPGKAAVEKNIEQTQELIHSETAPAEHNIIFSKEESRSNTFPSSPTSLSLETVTTEKGKEQREKSLEGKTSTGQYTANPKEELGNKPLPDTPSSKLPQGTHVTQPTITPETVLSLVAFGFIIFFFTRRAASKQGVSISFLLGRAIRQFLPKRCLHCNTSTRNNNRICDACKIRMDYDKAKTQEREAQEREARIRAEENKKRQEEARAREQRKRDDENARAREREGQERKARERAEENRRREEDRAQEQRRRSERARSNKPAAGQEFDPYQVLQVTRGASKDEIRVAYLNLIKQYHPDKVSHLGKEFRDIAEEKTQAINRAYEILTSI